MPRESTDQLVRCALAEGGRLKVTWTRPRNCCQSPGRMHGETQHFWSKANRKEREELVKSEVTKMEEKLYKVKAVSQDCQGGWTM